VLVVRTPVNRNWYFTTSKYLKLLFGKPFCPLHRGLGLGDLHIENFGSYRGGRVGNISITMILMKPCLPTINGEDPTTVRLKTAPRMIVMIGSGGGRKPKERLPEILINTSVIINTTIPLGHICRTESFSQDLINLSAFSSGNFYK
jgi:hypothetical protein